MCPIAVGTGNVKRAVQTRSGPVELHPLGTDGLRQVHRPSEARWLGARRGIKTAAGTEGRGPWDL